MIAQLQPAATLLRPYSDSDLIASSRNRSGSRSPSFASWMIFWSDDQRDAILAIGKSRTSQRAFESAHEQSNLARIERVIVLQQQPNRHGPQAQCTGARGYPAAGRHATGASLPFAIHTIRRPTARDIEMKQGGNTVATM